MLHALTLAAAVDFTLTDRTEARVRNPDPITNAPALDFDTLADARAVLRARTNLYTAAYMPRLSMLDVNGAGVQPALLHSGLAMADWNWPHVRLSLTENAAYGTQSFESLAALPAPGTPPPTPVGMPGQPPPLPTAQLTPAVRTFLFASSATKLASTVYKRPWTFITSVGYQVSGGADSQAQQVLPFQQGPFADASAGYAASSRDDLVTDVNGAEASFSNGIDDLFINAQERWTHRWRRATYTILSGGVSEVRERTGFTAPSKLHTNPIIEAEVGERFGRPASRFDLRLNLRLAPVVDRLSGIVDQRVQGVLGADWTHRRLLLGAFVTAAESANQGTPTSIRMIQGEIDASYRLSEALMVDGGARFLSQMYNVPGPAPAGGGQAPIIANNFAQSVIFVALTVQAPKVRF